MELITRKEIEKREFTNEDLLSTVPQHVIEKAC